MTNAIILAGGLGTRLGSVLNGRPKPMADVNGRPFLAYLLDYIATSAPGLTGFYCRSDSKQGVIMDYFGLSYNGLAIDYAVEGTPLGTGGAIRKALLASRSKDVFVLNGDSFFALTSMPWLEGMYRAGLFNALPETNERDRKIRRGYGNERQGYGIRGKDNGQRRPYKRRGIRDE